MPYNSSKQTEVIWRDSTLEIANCPPCVEEELCFIDKKMVVGARGKKVTERTKRSAYQTVREDPHTIATFHGFLERVKECCRKHRITCVVHDQRKIRLVPRLEFIDGFRFNQEDLFRHAEAQLRSGIVTAPTRYGKTMFIVNKLRVFPGQPSVVTLPGADLVDQMYEDLSEILPDRHFKCIGGSKHSHRKPSHDVTVCSMDSLHHIDAPTIRLLIADEPHAAVTDERLQKFRNFRFALRYAVGATLTGRYDGRDKLIEGLFGPVLASISFKEAVRIGAICPLHIIFLRTPYEFRRDFSRDVQYRRVLWHNDTVAGWIRWLMHSLVPKDWQSLIFISEEKQADFLMEHLGGESVVAMAKKLSKAERADLTARMKSNEIKRCISSNIFSTGMTFSDLRTIIMAGGGGGSITAIQKPGRLAEIRPGKKAGVIFDFWPYCKGGNPGERDQVQRDARARLQAYTDRGYEITFVDTIAQAALEFYKRAQPEFGKEAHGTTGV